MLRTHPSTFLVGLCSLAPSGTARPLLGVSPLALERRVVLLSAGSIDLDAGRLGDPGPNDESFETHDITLNHHAHEGLATLGVSLHAALDQQNPPSPPPRQEPGGDFPFDRDSVSTAEEATSLVPESLWRYLHATKIANCDDRGEVVETHAAVASSHGEPSVAGVAVALARVEAWHQTLGLTMATVATRLAPEFDLLPATSASTYCTPAGEGRTIRLDAAGDPPESSVEPNDVTTEVLPEQHGTELAFDFGDVIIHGLGDE